MNQTNVNQTNVNQTNVKLTLDVMLCYVMFWDEMR